MHAAFVVCVRYACGIHTACMHADSCRRSRGKRGVGGHPPRNPTGNTGRHTPRRLFYLHRPSRHRLHVLVARTQSSCIGRVWRAREARAASSGVVPLRLFTVCAPHTHQNNRHAPCMQPQNATYMQHAHVASYMHQAWDMHATYVQPCMYEAVVSR